MTWTDERVARLKELIADPARLSAGQIADKLGGVSRNGVIGKVTRLGLSLPNRSCGRNPHSRRRKLSQVRYIPAPAVELPPQRQAPIEPLHISLLDLTIQSCRWPYGERAPFTFCGHNKIKGSSYCAEHEALATGKRLAEAA